MSIYAIGDLHLSLSSNKPMDIFGPGWENHENRLIEGFSQIGPEDVTVLCGDISWAMGTAEAAEDFKFINALPGKKIILKGNHDYWWQTRAKLDKFFAENEITTVDILHNNCFFHDGVAICGTRGWFYEEEKDGAHDEKIMNRELMRLEASLKAAGDAEKICFLHYPPRWGSYICRPLVDILNNYGVKKCCYGHLHGPAHRQAITGMCAGVEYFMVAADHLGFKPLKIR
ncbi:MAG: metallophosphoesterase [Oscillospiraceae bacterium]|nr:metallophosphoesterase [Oscillospiraceae bacterium]